MNAATRSRTDAASDERSLLASLDGLLDREEKLMAARDAGGLHALADERERLTERLQAAARSRPVAARDPADDAELIALYSRLRHRHAVRAKVLRLHADSANRAMGVLAQASGHSSLYKADGRMARLYAPV